MYERFRSRAGHLLKMPFGLVMMMLCLAIPSHSQVTTADLVGTVRDNSGAVVRNVKVTLTNVATNVARNVVTDESGNYVFIGLQPGAYRLTAEADGFRRVERSGVELQVNQRAQVDIELLVGAVGETVQITGSAPLLESQSSVLGSVIQEQQVQDLPLNGRNFIQLAVLSPGVSGAGQGMRGTIMSGSRPDDLRPGTELFVNGNRESSNNYLYDGIDNNDRLTLAIIVRPAVEAIKEFKIQTNLFSAEQGRNPGGQVNVVTKSGSNDLHGTVYEFLRNRALDANNFFSNRARTAKPQFQQNQFGGALGGKLIRDKTFFFGDYDGFRQNLGRLFVNTVPTLKMRQGDFSEIAAGIFDPATTVQNGTSFTRQQFPNNIIPRDRWDPVMAKLINAYPLPTTSGLANNLVTTPVRKQNWDQFDVRIDHNHSDRNTFFGRYSWSKTATTNPYTFPAVNLPGVGKAVGIGNEDSFAGTSALTAQHLVLNWVHVISPRLMLDVRAGYARFHLDFIQADVNPGDKLANKLGIPNANQQDLQDALPIISPAGYTGIGHSRSLPILRRQNVFQYVANLTYSGSAHTIKTGFDVRRRQLTEYQTNRGNGRFNFAPNITNNPANNAGGHVMASFLLGAPSLIEQDYLLAWVGIRGTEYSTYIADDWRATQKLTLNLGMRYELDTPYNEVANRWANFDPKTATVLVAGRNGVGKSAGVNTFKKGFAPRLGFAYQAADKTVVRGGAGIFWNTAGHGGNTLRLMRHVPFGPIYSFSPGNFFVTRRVSDGFPTLPALNLANADNPVGSVVGVDPNYQPGYAMQFNLTVEQELPSSILLKASYVGNLGRHLDTSYNLNQAVPGAGAVNNRRPFFGVRPTLADVTWAVSDGLAAYHAFQFSAEKRLTNGLSGILSYTWGHSIDTVGQNFGGGADGPLPQNPLNRWADRGNSPFDIRHRLTIGWNYQLPFGKGRRWLSGGGPVDVVLGGWQINGINLFQTGLPFTPTANTSTLNTGTGSRPDRVGNGKLDNPTVDRWFDTSAFRTPGQFMYGNAGRNILYGPGRVNMDFSVFKEFSIVEGLKLQFRTEFFNVFNHTQFDLPNAAIGAGNAGTITSIVGTPRQIQFGLKLVF
ncbi:MAG: carboxypeptidase regulatory-like domain-containing protein [Acidobacteriota bacterium]